jgi:hypothetical protein
VIPKVFAVIGATCSLAAYAAQPPARPLPAASVVARAELVTTADEPLRTIRGDDGRIFLDFGKATFGWLRLEFSEPPPATELSVHLGEKKATTAAVDATPGASIAVTRSVGDRPPATVTRPLPRSTRPPALGARPPTVVCR